jgi:hypothetical protein
VLEAATSWSEFRILDSGEEEAVMVAASGGARGGARRSGGGAAATPDGGLASAVVATAHNRVRIWVVGEGEGGKELRL